MACRTQQNSSGGKMNFYAHTAELPDGACDDDERHWQPLSSHLRNVAALAENLAVRFSQIGRKEKAGWTLTRSRFHRGSKILFSIRVKAAVDGADLCHYIARTSLLFVSTAERGAACLQAALAFFMGSAETEDSA